MIAPGSIEKGIENIANILGNQSARNILKMLCKYFGKSKCLNVFEFFFENILANCVALQE